jgi:cytochrome c-type biogenesis protein CcmH
LLFATVARVRRSLVLVLCVLALASCDRKIEPFDPNEKPHEPDLSKIFPEGADSAEPPQPGLPPAPGEERGAPPLPSETASAESSGAAIQGTVQLAPELAKRVPANAVLFIIARGGGAGPPLAVKRVANPTFPLAFTIGPDDRMIKAMPFVAPIALTARIDSDGNATSRSPGDITGDAAGGPVAPGATDVTIVLDTPL